MSQSFKPSLKEGESSHSEYKQPDLIIIGDDESKNTQQNHTYTSEKNSQATEQPASTYQSIAFLRLVCVLGFVVCFIAAIFVLALFILFFILSLLTFFTNRPFTQALYASWKLYLNLVVATLGLGLGVFFPRVGLGLLLFYFAIKGETTDPGIWRQIFQHSFRQV